MATEYAVSLELIDDFSSIKAAATGRSDTSWVHALALAQQALIDEPACPVDMIAKVNSTIAAIDAADLAPGREWFDAVHRSDWQIHVECGDAITTDLEPVRQRRARFQLGQVVRWIDMHGYTVAKYMPLALVDDPVNGDTFADYMRFAGWIDGKWVGNSWPTFEAAIVALIAIKHEGYHTQADTYFLKMIGHDPEQGRLQTGPAEE